MDEILNVIALKRCMSHVLKKLAYICQLRQKTVWAINIISQ